MDREQLARAARRRQALDALQFEREREAMLVERLEDLLGEAEGERLDDVAFAKMEPAEADLVRAALATPPAEDLFEGEFGEDFGIELGEEEPDDEGAREEEIARLEQEVAASRTRQRAFERYLEALGD